MHNITRSNYTPKVGDYHNTFLHDPVKRKVWVFDCDGLYEDITKTNIIVVNEQGDSVDYAASQNLVTQLHQADQTAINNVDSASQARDTQLQTNLNQASTTLGARIEEVNTQSIARDTQNKNQLSARIDNADTAIATLNEVADGLADDIARLDSTAVFGVSLTQGTDVKLIVTDGTQQTETVFREANANLKGLMPASSYNQITKNTQDIQKLQNAGLYRGSFATVSAAPTSTPDVRFVGGEAFQNDVVTIQQATYESKTGVARYRISVDDDSNITYAFEHWVDKDVPTFDTDQAGLIVGSEEDGEIGANTDGTGAVNGWSTVKSDIATNAANIETNTTNITANTTAIASLGTRVTSAEGSVASIASRMTTAESDIADNTEAISTNTTAIAAINAKPVEGATTTTLGDNTEALLTTSGMMNHWVDITESGLPDDPDANTFYYTVAR